MSPVCPQPVNPAVSTVLLSGPLTSVKVAFYSSPLLAVIIYPSVPDVGLSPRYFHPPGPTVVVLNGCTQIQKAALILLITSCCTASFSAGAASNTATNICKV